MPQMGESIFEGTITKWLRKTGDKVQRDEPLFEAHSHCMFEVDRFIHITLVRSPLG